MKFSLNGEWTLYGFEQGKHDIESPSMLSEIDELKLEATVPGEAQLSLIDAGLLPKDIYKGMNVQSSEKYELYEWWYVKEFTAPVLKDGEQLFLEFEAVDCLAEYYLNDVCFGFSENAMIGFEFDITQHIKEGTNTLAVRLRSPLHEANYLGEYPLYEIAFKGVNSDSTQIRKPAHSYGWDIMPRLVTSGIWRNVWLVVKEPVEFAQTYMVTQCISENYVDAILLYELNCPTIRFDDDYKISVEGFCGDSRFYTENKIYYKKTGKLEFGISNPKLWWPHGYGEPNLYNVKVKLYNHNEIVAENEFVTGLRLAKLIRTDFTNGYDGCFKFNVNGVDIFAKGTNWVPLDAFHSKDLSRLEKAFEMVADLECNIIRCWGGNVYESEEFYNLCDKHGVMVWQDFGMACNNPSHTDYFISQIKQEVAYVVKSRRHHPCIVLWAGDNENDQMVLQDKFPVNPEFNRINREIIPQELIRHDRTRSYLASSPYVSDKVFEAYMEKINDSPEYKNNPENHIWGPRDYFKSRFYTENGAHFISETGYHGCPSRKSVEKFIDADCVWGYDNEQWILHSSDQMSRNHRVVLMANQVKQLFGEVPDNLDDFAYASQLSQAEAKKFMIERMRCGKPVKSGIIWWNLIDGWPQFSDAIVDYYYEKKLAYDYIKRCQKPFCFMMSEIDSWNITVIASNDTLTEKQGSYKVYEVYTDGSITEITKGGFKVEKNCNGKFAKIPVMYSDKRMFIIAWKCVDGEVGFNHYLAGMPPFAIEDYKKMISTVESFDVSKAF